MILLVALFTIVLFPYICAGVDCVLDLVVNQEHRSGVPIRELLLRDWFGWTRASTDPNVEGMPEAWARVARRPWSVRHDWVNVVTTYYEHPSQEVTGKFTGILVLVLWIVLVARSMAAMIPH